MSADRKCVADLLKMDASGTICRSNVRSVIDDVLACDNMISCGRRLECTWLAARMADRLRKQAA